jgi:uncharacterized membrane protein YeiB
MFYGWGLGLYGSLAPAAVTGIAVCVFVVVVAILNL